MKSDLERATSDSSETEEIGSLQRKMNAEESWDHALYIYKFKIYRINIKIHSINVHYKISAL